MSAYDAAFVAAASAALAWVFNRIWSEYPKYQSAAAGWLSLALCAWGAFVLISTVLARS